MIEHELVRTWGWLLALATNGLLLWIGWTLRKKFVTQEDFTAHLKAEESHKTAVSDRLAEHDLAVNALADKVNAMPGTDAIHALEVNLANIRGEQARTNEQVPPRDPGKGTEEYPFHQKKHRRQGDAVFLASQG